MGIIKRLKWKDKTGKTTDYDLGAKASNVEQDATHRFVSDTEKQTWNGKADPEDIPSGSAADYGVANNDTTNRTDMLVTAQVAYQHGKEIDQLNSETDRIRVYVGSDGKLHFVNKAGADSVLPFRGGGIAYIACVSSGGSYPNNTEYVIDKDTTVKILTTNDYMHVFLNNEEVHLTEIGTKDVTGHIGSWYAEISATKGDIVKISTSTGGGVAYSISY